MSRKILAIDASSAILLYKAAAEPLFLWQCLAAAYQVRMASAAFREVARPGYDGSSFFREEGGRLFTVVSAAIPGRDSSTGIADLSGIGPGEAMTLSLLLAGRVAFIAVDDKKAALICRRNRLPYVNALLMPRLLAISGLVSATFFEELFEGIRNVGRYSGAIVDFARNCPEEHLRPFLPLG